MYVITLVLSGALIELASGLVKRVEDLTVEDFRRSTELSPDLQLDVSTVDHIAMKAENTMTLVHFVVGSERLEVGYVTCLICSFYCWYFS